LYISKYITCDIYTIPATGCGVEHEFSIVGNIVTKRMNQLNVDSISEYMQYNRWVANKNSSSLLVMENKEETNEATEKEDMSDLNDEEDEFNQDLIEWLNEWEAKEKVER